MRSESVSAPKRSTSSSSTSWAIFAAHTTHPYGGFPAFTLTDHIKAALAATPIEATSRIAGIGLAVPNEVTLSGDVERVLGRDLTQAQRWIEREVSHPVYLQNDITAAASGESLFGVARPLSDFIYFYLGSRLHSRLILNHQIYNGRTAEHDTIGLARLSEALSRYDLSLQDLGLLDHHPAAAGAYAAWRRDCCKRIADAVGSLLHFVCVKSLVLSTYAPSSVAESLRAGLSDAMPTMQILLGRPSPTPKAVGAAPVYPTIPASWSSDVLGSQAGSSHRIWISSPTRRSPRGDVLRSAGVVTAWEWLGALS